MGHERPSSSGAGALTHRADKASADKDQGVIDASTLGNVLGDQTKQLSRQTDLNYMQADDLRKLNATISSLRQDLVGKISNSISILPSLNAAAVKQINRVIRPVDRNKCEYGTASIKPGVHFSPFLTTFKEAPSVTMFLNGFFARLDEDTYGQEGRLALNKRVRNVTVDGFYVSAEDLSDGTAEVDEVFYSYMACQFRTLPDTPHLNVNIL